MAQIDASIYGQLAQPANPLAMVSQSGAVGSLSQGACMSRYPRRTPATARACSMVKMGME